VALGIVVGFGLLLEDGSLWLTIPIGFAVILVVNKLGDVAMERSSGSESRTGELMWVIVAIALAGLAMMLYAAAKQTLTPKPPTYYGGP
jgi:hypothetical protein